MPKQRVNFFRNYDKFCLEYTLNLRFKFTDRCFIASQFLTPSFPATVRFFESLVLIEVLQSLAVFLYLGPQFTLCKFLFLLIPFWLHYRSYVLRLCDFLH